MSLVNLYKETIQNLLTQNKKISDIVFISTMIDGVEYELSSDDFFELAKGIDYDNGYGSVEINLRLKIVGDNWWLERYDFDGSEHWVFKTIPKRPDKKITKATAYLILNEGANHMGIRE